MTHVVWLSLYDNVDGRCCWDQAMVEALLRNEVWPTGYDFEHTNDLGTVPEGSGAVVVLPARYLADDVQALNKALAPLPWVLLMLTSDEESWFPWRELEHPNLRLWVMTPRPDEHEGAGRFLGEYWPPNTCEWLASMDASKPLDWFFAGQITHESREILAKVLGDLDGGEFVGTEGFTQGLTQDEYLRGLARAKVAPAPSGPATPDSFRLYEALEAGCVPVVEEACPAFGEGYWSLLLGERPPFPVVSSWAQLPSLLHEILPDWTTHANRCSAWWQGYKRRLATNLAADLAELGAPATDRGPGITVLMPTSPIPSHPDTAVIEETYASIRARLPAAEVIVMFDGVRSEQYERRREYEEYQRRVLRLCNFEWRNVVPLRFDRHAHQANMTRRALDLVRTRTVLFIEHDTPLLGDIPWDELVDVIASGQASVVRLHHEAEVLEPHRHLMLDTTPQKVAGAGELVPLLRTAQWSQRPHLASTGFYRAMLEHYFGTESRTMIEDVMHGVVDRAWREEGLPGWDRFRMWMYAPDGDMKRSTHLDGRGDDPKFEMVYAYDGPTPKGAPAPSAER